MDQSGSLLEIETSNIPKGSNKYHLFIKKTLQFLVPVSLLSFLLTYSACFSFICTYDFHFSTFVLPFFSHALERKYMFLICNGILAFLAKTLSLKSCSSPPVTDFNIHDEFIKSTEVKPTLLETSVYVIEKSVPLESVGREVEKEEEEEKKDKVEGNVKERKLQNGLSSLMIESGEIYSEGEAEEEEEYYETEESAISLIGGSATEEGNDELNLNTEELNRKFEEFIRKMKEEIRIEAQRQLVVA